ncbi:MAG: hypothetical protein EXR62_13985 [Chloroflexi bacterium]|nr:hypothetical protein [Chloroflexota bacterium]
MSYIRWFQDIGAADVSLVGGKGANLGEMVRAGLPVPPGFCLAAAAYRDFVQATGLQERINRILATAQASETAANPAEVEGMATQIRQLIVAEEVPEVMARQILAAYWLLAQELGSAAEAAAPVAVRSSATAEDLPSASFAGQQDTYLNIRGDEALLQHIKQCWASLWTARAVTYRTRQGFGHERVYLAVVVQAMIRSEISGILFTANPVTSNRNEVVINASWGLGEAIVSGLVTPDTYTVRKSDGVIFSREIASKELLIEYADASGTVEREIPAAQRTTPALVDEQIEALVVLARTIEAHYGKPQDIEWGYIHGKFYLLQSRPITTLAALTPEGDAAMEYNRTMFIEIFPDPLSPIFLSVIQPMFRAMLANTFKTLGFKLPKGLESVGVFYNQPYFNRNYIAAALQPLPPAMREQMVARIVNPFGQREGGAPRQLSAPVVSMALRLLRFMLRLPHEMPATLAKYRAEVAEVAGQPLEHVPDEQVAAHIRRLVFGPANQLMNNDFLLIALVGITCQVLDALLRPHFGAETEELRSKLISGVDGNVTMETNKRLWDLAQLAKASPSICDILRRNDGTDTRSRLEQTAEGRQFLAELERFLAEFGHREVRMDILYPTWGEDPSLLFGFIRGYLDSAASQSPYSQLQRLAAQRQEITRRVATKLGQGLKGRILILPLFRWILHHTQAHTRERDTAHFEMTRLFPPFRKLLLELGRRWTAQGLLRQPEDIFFLKLEQIEACARSHRSVKAEAEANRAEFEINRQRPWPDIIRGNQEIYRTEGHDTEHTPPVVAGEGELRGVAGSPGVVTGVARLIRGPEDFGRLQNGEILVAPFTNPVWTPLFAIAGGIVTEVGGILSHGAIVAREYGISAVMGVPGATKLIEEGQIVTVDGNRGIVRLGSTTQQGGD